MKSNTIPVNTLSISNKSFAAELIMTPLSELTYWEVGTAKDNYLTENGELKYDVIPVFDKGRIIILITQRGYQTINQEWFITSDTPIPDLVNLFIDKKKPAFLVVQYNDIIGLVTPADLNKLCSRVYIYSLIGSVELMLTRLIHNVITLPDFNILELLSTERSNEILTLVNKLQSQNVDIDLVQLLYLSDLLTIVEKTPVLRKKLGFLSRKTTEKELSGINDLRNKTMHLVQPILSKMPDDLKTLHKRLKRIRTLLLKGEDQ